MVCSIEIREISKIVREEFEKSPKNPQKWPKMADNFFLGRKIKNPPSTFSSVYHPLTACRKSKKSLEPFPRTFRIDQPTTNSPMELNLWLRTWISTDVEN